MSIPATQSAQAPSRSLPCTGEPQDARREYALDGPAPASDPRTTPLRGDLADISVAGAILVPHYVVPVPRWLIVDHCFVRKTAGDSAEVATELLRGESFCVLDVAGGWAWGYCAHDFYCGYLPHHVLGESEAAPRPAAPGADPASIARQFAGAPFAAGGRGGAGFDCAGLAQRVFGLAGQAIPRDADQQMAALAPLAGDHRARPGDIAFFKKGEVAIALDEIRMIHADEDAGAVIEEDLDALIARAGKPLAWRQP